MTDTTTAPAAASIAFPRPSVFRSRWAAVGAAVAVTLGAGGIGFVDAAPAPAPAPDHVRVVGLDFQPASSSLDNSNNVGRHTLQGHIIVNEFADGGNRCAAAPLDLPDGSHIKAVEIRYGAPNGGILQTAVSATAFAEQPIASEWDYSEGIAEKVATVKPASAIRTITLEADGFLVDNDASGHQVGICSDRLLTVHGALVHLG